MQEKEVLLRKDAGREVCDWLHFAGECLNGRKHLSEASCLVIGLGGGGLPVFLHRHLQLPTRVVELDQEVGKLAADHFGCHTSPGLLVTAFNPSARLSIHACALFTSIQPCKERCCKMSPSTGNPMASSEG